MKKIMNKIGYTLGMIFLFRAISVIPLPFLKKEFLIADTYSPFVLFGKNMSEFTINAIGIASYITASIFIQILTLQSKKIGQIAKQPAGEKIIKKITIIAGITQAVLISTFTTKMLINQYDPFIISGYIPILSTVIIQSLFAGLSIYIGESISQNGYGNGISAIILARILFVVPEIISDLNKINMVNDYKSILMVGIVLLLTIIIESMEIKVPVKIPFSQNEKQYVKIKLNIAGVMPIVLFGMLMQTVGLLLNYTGFDIMNYLPNEYILYVLFGVILFFFNKFYVDLTIDHEELLKNFQSQGVFIKNNENIILHPDDYLIKTKKSLSFLSFLIVGITLSVATIIFKSVGIDGIGSTSVLIAVGACMEMIRKILLDIKLTRLKF